MQEGVTITWTQNPLESKIHYKYALDSERGDLEGTHCGDCTYNPWSCGKCAAEEELGVYTIRGLNGAGASWVQSAFDNVDRLEDAIEWLREYDVRAKSEGYEEHIPRWERERLEALAWLQNYGRAHPELMVREEEEEEEDDDEED